MATRPSIASILGVTVEKVEKKESTDGKSRRQYPTEEIILFKEENYLEVLTKVKIQIRRQKNHQHR